MSYSTLHYNNEFEDVKQMHKEQQKLCMPPLIKQEMRWIRKELFDPNNFSKAPGCHKASTKPNLPSTVVVSSLELQI